MDKEKELRELDTKVMARKSELKDVERKLRVADKRKVIALNQLEDTKLQVGYEKKKKIAAEIEVGRLRRTANETEARINADCNRMEDALNETEVAAHKAQDEQKEAIKEQDKARSEQKKLKQDKIDQAAKATELAKKHKDFDEAANIHADIIKDTNKRRDDLVKKANILNTKIDESVESVNRATEARDQYAAKKVESDALIAENDVLNKGLRQAEKDAKTMQEVAKNAISEAQTEKQKYIDRNKVLELGYDELDRQKDAFRVTELRVRKLVKEKGIAAELKRLENALAK